MTRASSGGSQGSDLLGAAALRANSAGSASSLRPSRSAGCLRSQLHAGSTGSLTSATSSTSV